MITRQRRGKKRWNYFLPNGNLLRSKKHINWINKLQIPPAWENVCIASSPQARLQATGRDSKSRLQYLYHPNYRLRQEQLKYQKLVTMGEIMARARSQMRRHMRSDQMPREQTLACMLYLITQTYLRPGSHHYMKKNKSVGITTMQKKHVSLTDGTVIFEFPGKRQVKQRKEVKNRHVTEVVRRCMGYPGKFIFQYPHAKIGYKRVDQWELNDYIRQLTKPGYTAKDFRTWGGTLWAAKLLAKQGHPSSKSQAKKMAAQAIREVAVHLGNTAAVAKRSYVAPPLLQAYLQDGSTIKPLMERKDVREKAKENNITLEEQALIVFLKRCQDGPLKKAA